MSRSTGAARGSRALATCGALGVAAGMAAAGIALSAPAHAATGVQLDYTCSAPAIGLTFADPWTVTVDAAYPASVLPGASIDASQWNASITAGDDAATQFRALGIASWSGSVKFSYAVTGDVASAGDRSATLDVADTKLPTDGALSTDATGTAATEQAGNASGTATVTAADFTAALTTDAGVPVKLDCSLVEGQDATVASVQVAAAASSTSGTASPTGTATTTPVTTGPPIITDGNADGGNANTGALVGVGVGVGGAALLAVGARRRVRGERR